MNIVCPYCQYRIIVKNPKSGKYTPRCPRCQGSFSLTVPDDLDETRCEVTTIRGEGPGSAGPIFRQPSPESTVPTGKFRPVEHSEPTESEQSRPVPPSESTMPTGKYQPVELPGPPNSDLEGTAARTSRKLPVHIPKDATAAAAGPTRPHQPTPGTVGAAIGFGQEGQKPDPNVETPTEHDITARRGGHGSSVMISCLAFGALFAVIAPHAGLPALGPLNPYQAAIGIGILIAGVGLVFWRRN